MSASKVIMRPDAPGPAMTESDARVLEIVREMMNGKWSSAKSLLAKSKKWNLSMSRVKDLSTEAARFIRMSIGHDDEEIRSTMIAEIEAIGQAARKGITEQWSETSGVIKLKKPNYAAGLAAIMNKAELLKMTGKQSKEEDMPDWASLSNVQKLERIDRVRARMSELEQQVRADMANDVKVKA